MFTREEAENRLLSMITVWSQLAHRFSRGGNTVISKVIINALFKLVLSIKTFWVSTGYLPKIGQGKIRISLAKGVDDLNETKDEQVYAHLVKLQSSLVGFGEGCMFSFST